MSGGALPTALNAVTKDDEDRLASLLYRQNKAAFEQALRNEVARAGGDPTGVALTNRAVQRIIRQDAKDSASSIRETLYRDFERFAAAIPAGTIEADVPRLYLEWESRRTAWKNEQIAVTESTNAAGFAQRTFLARAKPFGLAWFGHSLKCPLCRRIAAGNPYELSDSTVGMVPHPGCMDSWTTEYERLDGEVWTGG